MPGYYTRRRGWREDSFFAAEPYTEREAWDSLCEQRAFRPHRVWVGGKEYVVGLDEVVTSLASLAEDWGWTRSKVRRFLERLKAAGMIRLMGEERATRITVTDERERPRSSRNATVGHKTGTIPDTTSEQLSEQENPAISINSDVPRHNSRNEVETTAERKSERLIETGQNHDSQNPVGSDSRPRTPRRPGLASAEFARLFGEFWRAYPRRVKRKQAEDKFGRLLRDAAEPAALFGRIMAGVERYKRTKPAWQDWAHPTSWLSAERWEDEDLTDAGENWQQGNIPFEPRVVVDNGAGHTRGHRREPGSAVAAAAEVLARLKG